DGSVMVWEVRSRRALCRLEGQKSFFPFVAFAPDGRALVAGNPTSPSILWELLRTPAGIRARRRATLGDSEGSWCGAFAPDGRVVATGTHEGDVRLWDAATGRERGRLRGHVGEIRSLSFTPDGGTLASTGLDATIRLWNLKLLQEVIILRRHRGL